MKKKSDKSQFGVDNQEDMDVDPKLLTMMNFGGGDFETEMLPIPTATGTNKRAEILKNVIAMSKKAKALRQMQKEEQIERIDRLNDLFLKLQNTGDLLQCKLPIEKEGKCEYSYDDLYLQLKHDESNCSIGNLKGTPPLSKNVCSKNVTELLNEFESCSQNSSSDSIKLLSKLTLDIHEQIKKDAFTGMQHIRAIILTCHYNLSKKKENFIEFYQLALLEIASRLFSFKFYHPVCAPLLFYMVETVGALRIRSPNECLRAIILCKRIVEWTADSGRYIPEVVAFLLGSLQLSVENNEQERFPTMSFPISMPYRQMLYIDDNFNKEKYCTPNPISLSELFSKKDSSCMDGDEDKKKTNVDNFSTDVFSDGLKLSSIRVIMFIIRDYSMKCSTRFPLSFCSIFRPFLALFKRLPIDKYPAWLSSEVVEVKRQLDLLITNCLKVTQMKRIILMKVKPLKLLEPRFDEHYNPESFGSISKFNKQKRLKQKLRKETRGAMKNLRKDAKFISKFQSDSAYKISRERIDKTKRIMQTLQVQESEYKKRKLKKN